jgi:hypothetical protein
VEICRAPESAHKHAAQMQSVSEVGQRQMLIKLLNASKPSSNSTKWNNSKESGGITSCRFCGGQHPHGKCPAYGKSCAKCGALYNFAKVGEQSAQQQSQQGFYKRFDRPKINQQHTNQTKNCSSLQTESEVNTE